MRVAILKQLEKFCKSKREERQNPFENEAERSSDRVYKSFAIATIYVATCHLCFVFLTLIISCLRNAYTETKHHYQFSPHIFLVKEISINVGDDGNLHGLASLFFCVFIFYFLLIFGVVKEHISCIIPFTVFQLFDYYILCVATYQILFIKINKFVLVYAIDINIFNVICLIVNLLIKASWIYIIFTFEHLSQLRMRKKRRRGFRTILSQIRQEARILEELNLEEQGQNTEETISNPHQILSDRDSLPDYKTATLYDMEDPPPSYAEAIIRQASTDIHISKPITS